MVTKNLDRFAFRLIVVWIVILGVFASQPANSAYASSFTVTNTNDNGVGSLRQAIASAANGDTIQFAPSLAGQTITITSTISLQKSITIDGSSLNPRVEISGGNAVRIFVADASSAITPTIRNVVLKDGKQTGLSYTYFGGALFVGSDTTLTLDKVLITGNAADTAGAIYVAGNGVLRITSSEIRGNRSDKTGGAIYVNSIGLLNLKNSIISENVSGSAGTIYFSGATNSSVIENNVFENNSATSGGAILGQLGNARIEIRNNLFSSNHALTGTGGAVYFSASSIPTQIVLENNTFYGNVASTSGGGAYFDMGPEVYLINNTFSNNQATTGGNLYIAHGGSVSKMYNNIIANHAGGGDCYAFYNSYLNGSNNIVEDGGIECSNFTTGDPGLAPLADNGGPTMTMALLPGSPAIDAGNNSFCTSTDQRGTPRPQGTTCDLGALELDQTPPTVLSSKPGNEEVFIADAFRLLQITFSEPMNQYLPEGRVDDPSNYILLNDLGNGFQTASCFEGVAAQDQTIAIDGISYNGATRTSSLTVNNGIPLPNGNYRLFVCGTSPAITDVSGISLNEGASDATISFQVISMSGNRVAENQPAGTSVLTLVAPSGSNFSYELEANGANCSGMDNGSFSFSNDTLLTTTSFDYESKALYTICVKSGESGRPAFFQELSIYVDNVNEVSLDILLSKNTVNENSQALTQVGSLSTEDPDADSSFAYSLTGNVPDCNGTDNSSFLIIGNILRTSTVFDYEVQQTYRICIRSTDNGGASIHRPFTITVLNTNDAPLDILLTPPSILENQPGYTLVGNLIAVDPDGPTTSTFSSIPGKIGCSSTGFNWFVITNGNEIRSLAPLNANVASSYTLCIRAMDSLNSSIEKQLTIAVIDITAPWVTSVSLADANPTNASIVHFTVIFSEPVTGVDKTDFALYTTGLTGVSIAGVTGSNNQFTVTANTGSGNGSIRLDVIHNYTIKDAANNLLTGDFNVGPAYSIVKSAAIPSVPKLLSPAMGTQITSLRPELDWKDSIPDADYYQLQIATNSTFTTLVINKSDILISTFVPDSDLVPGKLYYWHVKAFNRLGQANAWSTVWTFKTPLAQPILVSPTEAETLLIDRPAFDWDTVDGATQYNLQVSAVSNFGTLLVNATVNGTEYAMTKDLPQNKTIYWRVRAKTPVVTSPWSVKGSFTTGNPPSMPVLIAPTNNALIRHYTPKFDWKNSTVPTGAIFKHYELEMDDNADFSSPEIRQTPSVSDFTPDAELASNTKYYWRVRAVSTVVNPVTSAEEEHVSTWSSIWSFRTIIPAPTGLTVIPNGLKPTFEWDDAAGPGTIKSYTIQISTSASFGTFLVNSTTPVPSYDMLKDLPAGKTLYLRVRVNGANGPSGWTSLKFSVP